MVSRTEAKAPARTTQRPTTPPLPAVVPSPAGSVPTSLPPLVPGADVAWWALNLQLEGILHKGPTLQVGFKCEFRGSQGRLGLYFGNIVTSPLLNISSSVGCSSATQQALSIQAAAAPTTLAPRGNALQMIQLEGREVFTDPPTLNITFSDSSGRAQQLSLRLPLMPVRFVVPWQVASPPVTRSVASLLEELPVNSNDSFDIQSFNLHAVCHRSPRMSTFGGGRRLNCTNLSPNFRCSPPYLYQ